MADPGREVASVVVGGACGGLLVEALARRGVMPVTAATAVAVGGGLGALALRGTARQVAVGAAAASVGRLALALVKRWLAVTATPTEAGSAVAEPPGQVAPKPPAIVLEIPMRRQPPVDVDAGVSGADVEGDIPGAEAAQESVQGGAGESGSEGVEKIEYAPCPARCDGGKEREGARDRAAGSVC
jgi:hypothetical protein